MISVSEKRMKNCIVKIIDNVFEKVTDGGLFPLISHCHLSHCTFFESFDFEEKSYEKRKKLPFLKTI